MTSFNYSADITQYENLCRTCLLQKSKTQSLFEENIDKMLMEFTSLQVSLIHYHLYYIL